MVAIYEWIHNSLGMCFWTLPMLILLVVAIVMFVVHMLKQKNRNKDDDYYKRKCESEKQSAGIAQ